MKMSKRRIAFYISVAIFWLLIATNPSRIEFASHLGLSKVDGTSRKSNYFIFSVYTMRHDIYTVDDTDNYHIKSDHYTYFAILGNFFKINP